MLGKLNFGRLIDNRWVEFTFEVNGGQLKINGTILEDYSKRIAILNQLYVLGDLVYESKDK